MQNIPKFWASPHVFLKLKAFMVNTAILDLSINFESERESDGTNGFLLR